jgi:hypothetical protein
MNIQTKTRAHTHQGVIVILLLFFQNKEYMLKNENTLCHDICHYHGYYTTYESYVLNVGTIPIFSFGVKNGEKLNCIPARASNNKIQFSRGRFLKRSTLCPYSFLCDAPFWRKRMRKSERWMNGHLTIVCMCYIVCT